MESTQAVKAVETRRSEVESPVPALAAARERRRWTLPHRIAYLLAASVIGVGLFASVTKILAPLGPLFPV